MEVAKVFSFNQLLNTLVTLKKKSIAEQVFPKIFCIINFSSKLIMIATVKKKIAYSNLQFQAVIYWCNFVQKKPEKFHAFIFRKN